VGAVSERPWAFTHIDEVRFSDLDVMGHLNNVAFLQFVESARVGYVRSLLPGHDPSRAGSFGGMVAHAEIDYRAPGHLGDRIETRIRPTVLGRTSLGLEFEMRIDERVIAQGNSTLVLWDRDAARPLPIPPLLRERLAADGGRERDAAPAPLTKL